MELCTEKVRGMGLKPGAIDEIVYIGKNFCRPDKIEELLILS
jgi:hypothetical protein